MTDYCVHVRIYVKGKSREQALREVWKVLSDEDYVVDEVYDVSKPSEV